MPLSIDYGFYSKKVSYQNKIKNLNEKYFNIVTVANFREYKNLDVMIKAFILFNKKIPKSNFIVIGGDYLNRPDIFREQKGGKPSIDEMVKESRNIFWLGQTPPKRIREIFSICDVFVSSSTEEAQGLTNYEAGAAGKALCFSDIPSLRLNFKNSALYHKAKDFKKLSENFMKYYKGRKLREENAGKAKKLVKGWDYSVLSRKLKKIYKSLL